MIRHIAWTVCALGLWCFCSCGQKPQASGDKQQYLYAILQDADLPRESRYTAINAIAETLSAERNYNQLILFLTDYVEKTPEDMFNAYWLLITAYAYLELNAPPVAEYYFDRIIKTCGDLMVRGQSIHLTCLQNLIKISKNPQNRIYYFTELINRFSNRVNPAELYFRLASEYEKLGEWDLALKAYTAFMEQSGAQTLQLAGVSDPYTYARNLITFNDSPKNWTFDTLDALAGAVKTAIGNHNYSALERYKSKVNFFAMSWKQEETDLNSQRTFYIQNFMMGRQIHCNEALDASSNPNEAYLRTWGWGQVSNWYFYFRKVNFPVDPDIHGKWEWAGIYFGEKL
jgi:tetratricopeptide (TPR) repeat protein